MKAILYAFLAAVFYAINIPASKVLLRDVELVEKALANAHPMKDHEMVFPEFAAPRLTFCAIFRSFQRHAFSGFAM